ncbi:MAG: asparagine synthase-related protein [Candidatus Marsarchaeota archaeon]|nr:asparagine synthase-related protein [Candidatus Marsarchaeota archaeon]
MSQFLVTEMRAASELVGSSVRASVARLECDALILSGGLDTSIISYLASGRGMNAYTVYYQEAPGPDVDYARRVADEAGFHHRVIGFSYGDYIEAASVVARVMNSFDPMEIRNSAPVLIALRNARSDGCIHVATGDGSDELFAGYSYLFSKEPASLRVALEHLWKVMRFSAVPLGATMGLNVESPYLDAEVKEAAFHVHPSLLVGVNPLTGAVTGKFVLRKAFESLLPADIVWRKKAPIEEGCGSTSIPGVIELKVSDAEFQEKSSKYLEEEGVRLRGKEHLVYYEIYRAVNGPPKKAGQGRSCPGCGSSVPAGSNFCTVCGAYPV